MRGHRRQAWSSNEQSRSEEVDEFVIPSTPLTPTLSRRGEGDARGSHVSRTENRQNPSHAGALHRRRQRGQPLVFLHGAGGATTADPFLAKLAAKYHLYAPLLPGYGDSEECHTIRDMLDFTLHTWDVVEALGLKNPILVGHSMGGMIAAEMAAIAPNDVTRLGLICPAGLWLDAYPIPDLFATMPFEMPKLLFHDVEAGTAMLTAGLQLDDPEVPAKLSGHQCAPARHGGQDPVPGARSRPVGTALSHQGEDGPDLG